MKFNFTGTKFVKGMKWFLTAAPVVAGAIVGVLNQLNLTTGIGAGVVTVCMLIIGFAKPGTEKNKEEN